MNGCRTASATTTAMIARLGELAARANEAGRDPIPITIAGMMRDPARIERFERAGVYRGVFWLPSRGPDEVEAAMDRYAAAGAGVRAARAAERGCRALRPAQALTKASSRPSTTPRTRGRARRTRCSRAGVRSGPSGKADHVIALCARRGSGRRACSRLDAVRVRCCRRFGAAASATESARGRDHAGGRRARRSSARRSTRSSCMTASNFRPATGSTTWACSHTCSSTCRSGGAAERDRAGLPDGCRGGPARGQLVCPARVEERAGAGHRPRAAAEPRVDARDRRGCGAAGRRRARGSVATGGPHVLRGRPQGAGAGEREVADARDGASRRARARAPAVHAALRVSVPTANRTARAKPPLN